MPNTGALEDLVGEALALFPLVRERGELLLRELANGLPELVLAKRLGMASSSGSAKVPSRTFVHEYPRAPGSAWNRCDGSRRRHRGHGVHRRACRHCSRRSGRCARWSSPAPIPRTSTGSTSSPSLRRHRRGAMTRALSGCETLYHLAAIHRAWMEDPTPSGLRTSRHVVDAARRAERRRAAWCTRARSRPSVSCRAARPTRRARSTCSTSPTTTS